MITQPTYLEIYANFLTKLGYKIISASTVAEAIGHLRKSSARPTIDLVVVDTQIDDLTDARELLDAITQETHNLPVLISTNGDVPKEYRGHLIHHQGNLDQLEAMVKHLLPAV